MSPAGYTDCDTPSFNPRTREGCDDSAKGVIALCQSFNPRTREGCDREDVQWKFPYAVSIHAPVKGAMAIVISHCN